MQLEDVRLLSTVQWHIKYVFINSVYFKAYYQRPFYSLSAIFSLMLFIVHLYHLTM